MSGDFKEFAAAQEVDEFGVVMYFALSADDPIMRWTHSDENHFPKCVRGKVFITENGETFGKESWHRLSDKILSQRE